LVLTVRHFFPDLNRWLDRLPDTRDPDSLIYQTRFLGWWGIPLYLWQLGSRRQLDFELDARGTCVLPNINRLAGTDTTHVPSLTPSITSSNMSRRRPSPSCAPKWCGGSSA
jgi:hypothetical protein